MNQLNIRLCKTWDECVECEELQKQVWEMPDYRDAVPASFLITAIKNGGLLVGAFDDEKMVGFVFGFLGIDDHDGHRRFKHTSHMLGVLPGVRAHGLGADLKWFQREAAMGMGLDLMTWTYDPLQAVNARLNLSRLGAIARRYYRDAYGEMTDALNVGLASDRFEVEWYLTGARVKQLHTFRGLSLPVPDAQAVYEIGWNDLGFPVIQDEKPLKGSVLRLEIPPDINAMKRGAPALAIQWRVRTRSTFERAFAAGYVAIAAERATGTDGRSRTWYLLEHEPR